MLIIEKHSISHTKPKLAFRRRPRGEEKIIFIIQRRAVRGCEGWHRRRMASHEWASKVGSPNEGGKGRKGKKKFNRSTKNRIKINKRRKKLLKVRWKSVMSELVSKSCDMQWRGHLDNCRLAKRHRTDTHLQVH